MRMNFVPADIDGLKTTKERDMKEDEFWNWIEREGYKRPIPTSVLQAAISTHGYFRVVGLLRKFRDRKLRDAGDLRKQARQADFAAKRMAKAIDWVSEISKTREQNSPRYNTGPRSREGL